jgi:hypothetical protein
MPAFTMIEGTRSNGSKPRTFARNSGEARGRRVKERTLSNPPNDEVVMWTGSRAARRTAKRTKPSEKARTCRRRTFRPSLDSTVRSAEPGSVSRVRTGPPEGGLRRGGQGFRRLGEAGRLEIIDQASAR